MVLKKNNAYLIKDRVKIINAAINSSPNFFWRVMKVVPGKGIFWRGVQSVLALMWSDEPPLSSQFFKPSPPAAKHLHRPSGRARFIYETWCIVKSGGEMGRA